MKKLSTLLLSFVFICVLNAQNASAQTKEEKEAAKKAQKEKQKKEKEEAKAAKAKAEFEKKNPIQVNYEYDKFQDLSKVVLTPLHVPSKILLYPLSFSSGYMYSGNVAKEPERVFLAFGSLGDFPSYNELILIIDSERLNLGAGQRLERQAIIFDVTMETLNKIANANSVEGRISGGSDNLEFTLTSHHINAVKALLKYQQNTMQ